MVDWLMKCDPRLPGTWAVFPGEPWLSRSRGPGALYAHAPRDENQPCPDAETRIAWGSKASALPPQRRWAESQQVPQDLPLAALTPDRGEPPDTTHGG